MKDNKTEKNNVNTSCKTCKHCLRLVAVGFGYRCNILKAPIPNEICDKYVEREPDKPTIL